MSQEHPHLEQGLRAGFVNRTYPALNEYLPQFLVNDAAKHKKVLSSILSGLRSCDEFWFSVAFVTTSGVATLIQTLVALESVGIRGKILVSQYLYFTQPEALRRLLQFRNLELRIAVDGDFHSKGYLFQRKGNLYDLIIGSSNLTAAALSTNTEWNLKVSATNESYLIQSALREFQVEFQKAKPVDEAYILLYQTLYLQQLQQAARFRQESPLAEPPKPTPNLMQTEAMASLGQLRQQGVRKALLISATGTGKTYLSAFDAMACKAKRLLFVVHRSRIAATAMETFRTLWGSTRTYGLFTDGHRQTEADFVFTTVQTLSRPENLAMLAPDAFDYMVLDETHRAGAASYRKVLDYFRPGFLLGMTATPERTDGMDIFELFDHQIAYEIRLHRALEEDILSPFHYYGVSDLIVNGNVMEDVEDFNLLLLPDRAKKVVEKARLYGTDNGETRGLIFVSSVAVGQQLSELLNTMGWRTVFLSGSSSDEQRAQAIQALESDPQALDYILTVDIFNEGIDIPRVNQVILLRPTESAIVFVQQLGRGLRKIPGKEYLTVIDFIGNYQKNFLVPVALYGDTTYNKDTLRKLLTTGSNTLPGTSTVNFDPIAKERIYAAIDQANMSKLSDLRDDYKRLRFQLGRVPMMVDFLEHGQRDPMLYVDYDRSYANFVLRVEGEAWTGERLDAFPKKLLELFSQEINNAKRVTESVVLEALLGGEVMDLASLNQRMQARFGLTCSHQEWVSVQNNLNFGFVNNPHRVVREQGGALVMDVDLEKALENSSFRAFLSDSVSYALRTFTRDLAQGEMVGGFVRYRKYGRKDVCRILHWEKDVSSTVYGYRTVQGQTPLFVTYHKAEDVTESTKYKDAFVDPSTFAWQSRSNRRLESSEIQEVISSRRILLFIKKEDAEGKDFYYMGDVMVIEGSVVQDFMPIQQNPESPPTPVVNFCFSMDTPVDEAMFEYLRVKA